MCLSIMFKRLFIFYTVSFVLSAPLEHVEEEEFHIGKKAVILCTSNDKDHNFYAWELPNQKLITPEDVLNETKYDIEVLPGKLIIKDISKQDEGVYVCISRAVRGTDLKYHKVRVLVREDWKKVYEQDKSVNYFRIVVVIGSCFLIIGGVFYAYKLITNKRRLPRYLETSDDEESGEELFSAPSTSKPAESAPMITKASTSGYEKLQTTQ